MEIFETFGSFYIDKSALSRRVYRHINFLHRSQVKSLDRDVRISWKRYLLRQLSYRIFLRER